MTICCPICYRPGSGKDTSYSSDTNFEKVVQQQKRFCKLFERYLTSREDGVDYQVNAGETKTQLEFMLQDVTEFGMVTCEDCRKVMESFCDIYSQIKSLELLLDGTVFTLKNIMKGAQNESSRLEYLRDCLEKLKGDEIRGNEMIDTLKLTKKSLLDKCSIKLSKSFPKLKILRWKSATKKSSNEVGTTPGQRNKAIGALNTVGKSSNTVTPSTNYCEEDKHSLLNSNSTKPTSQTGEAIELIPKYECPDTEEDHLMSTNFDQDDTPVNTTLTNLTENIGTRLRAIHRCSKCSRTFSSLEKLEAHVNSHDSSSSRSASPSSANEVMSDDDVDALSWISSSSSISEGVDEEIVIPNEMGDNDHDPGLPCGTPEPRVICNESVSKAGLINIADKIPNPEPNDMPTRKTPKKANLQVKIIPKPSKSIKAKVQNKPIRQRSNSVKAKRKKEYKKYRGNVKLYRQARYKCPDCDSLLPTLWSLLIHRQNSQACSTSLDPKTSVKVEVLLPQNPKKMVHLESNSTVFAIIDLPQEIFTCELCHLPLCSEEDLTEHKKLHGRFNCNFCQAEFNYAKGLARHELTHFMDKQTPTIKQCPRCDIKFSNGVYPRHHLKSHLDLTLHEPICAICNSTSNEANKSNDSFPGHLKRYHDLSRVTDPKEIYRCTLVNCSAYFLRATQLKEHSLRRHNLNEYRKAAFPCTHCDESYKSIDGLRVHRLNVHVREERLIPCSIKTCLMLFENQKDMETHLDKHDHSGPTGPRKYKIPKSPCSKCGRMISQHVMKSHLRGHDKLDKIETGELTPHRFVCEQCGRTTVSKQALEIHHLSHTGPSSWKFSCGVCSKKCMTKVSLGTHMRVHTQEKPYVCQICGVKYSQPQSLKSHVNSKHGDESKTIPRVDNPSPSKKGVKRKIVEESSTDTPDDSDSE